MNIAGIRGRVYKVGRVWVYQVKVNGVTVLTDNAIDWRLIFDRCLFDVAAARRVVLAGHVLRPYADLVEEARAAA